MFFNVLQTKNTIFFSFLCQFLAILYKQRSGNDKSIHACQKGVTQHKQLTESGKLNAIEMIKCLCEVQTSVRVKSYVIHKLFCLPFDIAKTKA